MTVYEMAIQAGFKYKFNKIVDSAGHDISTEVNTLASLVAQEILNNYIESNLICTLPNGNRLLKSKENK
jgi:hypothetical protein